MTKPSAAALTAKARSSNCETQPRSDLGISHRRQSGHDLGKLNINKARGLHRLPEVSSKSGRRNREISLPVAPAASQVSDGFRHAVSPACWNRPPRPISRPGHGRSNRRSFSFSLPRRVCNGSLGRPGINELPNGASPAVTRSPYASRSSATASARSTAPSLSRSKRLMNRVSIDFGRLISSSQCTLLSCSECAKKPLYRDPTALI